MVSERQREFYFSSRELQIGREKVASVVPLLVVKNDERLKRIARMRVIPGTSVRISRDGDIFYPVWRERTRIDNPELYLVISKLPRGWNLERLLKSKRERLISEIVFCQVRKDGGTVEAAIRSMNHVLTQYSEKSKEMEQIIRVRLQIGRAMKVLEETRGINKEEFEEGFGNLYGETIEIMESIGMKRAVSRLKKEIEFLLEKASSGKNGIGRRNPLAVLKRLEAAAKRVECRYREVGYIVDKFLANKAGLIAEREKERKILVEVLGGLVSPSGIVNHVAFKRGKIEGSQLGILVGILGTMMYKLEGLLVKPYRPLSLEVKRDLAEIQRLVKEGNCDKAKGVILELEEKIRYCLENSRIKEDLLG